MKSQAKNLKSLTKDEVGNTSAKLSHSTLTSTTEEIEDDAENRRTEKKAEEFAAIQMPHWTDRHMVPAFICHPYNYRLTHAPVVWVK